MPNLSLWVRAAVLISSVVVSLGCAKDEANVRGDIFASWCGRPVESPEQCTGDEVPYVELAASDGRAASGVHCEAYGKECYALVDTERTPGGIRYATSSALSVWRRSSSSPATGIG
jgi:hypothetical protein